MKNSIILGHAPQENFWQRFYPKVVGVSHADARAHAHIIGKTGMGKSFLVADLVVNLLSAGKGVALIDPHGALTKLVLGLIAEHPNKRLLERTIYLDFPEAERQQRYLPFNILKQPHDGYTIAGRVMEAFHRAFPELGGNSPMFDTLLHAGTKVAVSNDKPLFPTLWRLLIDKSFRHHLLAQEADPEIVSVFRDFYDPLGEKEQRLQAGSLLRRLYLLTASPVLKHSLGQEEMQLDFREIMDSRKGLLVNLDVSDDASARLLGCLLTSFLERTGRDRPSDGSAPEFFVFIDEFGSFNTRNSAMFTKTLSEMRKYNYFLGLIHQNWSQADEKLQGSMQNCNIEVVFQLGRTDAEIMARSLAMVEPKTVSTRVEATVESISREDQLEAYVQRIQTLKKRHALVRLPDNSVEEFKTPNINTPTINTSAIEREMLEKWFRAVGISGTELEPTSVLRPKFTRE